MRRRELISWAGGRRGPLPLLLALLLIAELGSTACRRRLASSDATPDATVDGSITLAYPAAPGRIAELAKRLSPSVVHLRAEVPVHRGPADWFSPSEEPPPAPLAPWHDRFRRALGSGVVVDRGGAVLTNLHLVGDRTQVTVVAHDGTEIAAAVAGRDDETNLALLRLKGPRPSSLRPPRFAGSAALHVGEALLALSNPFGHGAMVSSGIVSATYGHDLPAAGRGRWAYVQTDLAIHPGNAGGAVVNRAGELVGIAVALAEKTAGIGFVLPIDTARRLIPVLERGGRVARSWTGMVVVELTKLQAEQSGLKQTSGALVKTVVRGGPAERAGIRGGDVVVRFDDTTVRDAQQLRWLAALAGVGRVVSVEVWRASKRVLLPLRTVAMP